MAGMRSGIRSSGLAKYAIDYPLKDRVICTDDSRYQFKWRDGDNDDSGYHIYMDAIGYSWDPNYNIGDNLKEGLLLSYGSNIDLDIINHNADSLNKEANDVLDYQVSI